MPNYEITSPDGRKFTITVPEGTSRADVLKYAQQNMPAATPERGTGERLARGVGLFGKGVNDAVGTTAAAPVEAVNWLMKQPGRAAERFLGVNVPNVLPEGGSYIQKAQDALNAFGRNDTPENTTEKALYGAGQGVGNAASVVIPGAAVARAAQAGGVASGVGRTLASQPVTQAIAGGVGGAVGEATDNPLYGAAASLAVPFGVAGVRGVISPGSTRLSPETRRLVDVAKAEGIPLTPGQITGTRPLRTLESVFSTLPTTAGPQSAIEDAQRVAFNKAVMLRAGERHAERATPDVVQGFLDRAGGDMRKVYESNTFNLDAKTAQAVRDLARDARRELTDDVARPIINRVDDLIQKVTPAGGGRVTIDGRTFGELDSIISRDLRETQNGTVRRYLDDLQETLRDGFQSQLSADDAEVLLTARRHYANGKVIEKAMNSQNVQTVAGNIPPAALSQAVAAGPGGRFARGLGDLNDLARVGRAFVQEVIPNSATPERNAIMNLITGGAAGGGMLAGGADLGTAALTTAAVLGGPRAVQSGYNSQLIQRYLTNQLAAGAIPPLSPGLLGATAVGNAPAAVEQLPQTGPRANPDRRSEVAPGLMGPDPSAAASQYAANAADPGGGIPPGLLTQDPEAILRAMLAGGAGAAG